MLSQLVSAGLVDVINVLHGADATLLREKDELGWTCAHVAAGAGRLEVVDALIRLDKVSNCPL